LRQNQNQANSQAPGDSAEPRFRDTNLPIEERVEDLIGRLSLDEKISQLAHQSAAIPRLGIPQYDWWSECLHGVARAGMATVFPQAIGMAASFNDRLLYRVATAISDEARAKHHEALRCGNRGQYFGLTFWSPNINIFRDPRWGRGQETYGEDPYLTSRMGVTFVKGLQGNDPKYLKLVATPKHFAAHSGPEAERHHFDAQVSRRDLHETYLPAFRACVKAGKAASIMGAYSRLNGEPCCASDTLLEQILRDEWGFDGYVVSDCGALRDIHGGHRVTRNLLESAVLALQNGCDLNCGAVYNHLRRAVVKGLLDEKLIERALRRLLSARFRLGMFDPPEDVPYASISPDVVACEEHQQLALEMARQSIVLLKNEDNLLPLDRSLRSVAVVGPNAESLSALLGNYTGYPSQYVTPLAGILNAVSVGAQVLYRQGCGIWQGRGGIKAAVQAAEQADVVIAVLGLTAQAEGEEGSAPQSEAHGDRIHVGLPDVQGELLRALHATGVPVVLVLMSGSPLAVTWADENIPAILHAWYPGQAGGRALAEVLFGDYNPAGRLPVTFIRSLDQLPLFSDYSMSNRTYRFMMEEPLYPFGYGLSYTQFRYSKLQVSPREIGAAERVKVTVQVQNVGPVAGDEVVQLYLSDVEASVPVPQLHLEGFRRVHLGPGQARRLTFTIAPRQLAAYRDDGAAFVEPGEFIISVGGGQPTDPTAGALQATLTVRERH